MSIELNHTIVHARDNRESAEFLAHILGLTPGTEWGPFIPVATSNGVTLDFATVPADSITTQHYAFLVSDDEFDRALERISRTGGPFRRSADEATRRDQPQSRRAGPVLPRSRGSRHGDHHPPLRQRGADTARGVSAV